MTRMARPTFLTHSSETGRVVWDPQHRNYEKFFPRGVFSSISLANNTKGYTRNIDKLPFLDLVQLLNNYSTLML